MNVNYQLIIVTRMQFARIFLVLLRVLAKLGILEMEDIVRVSAIVSIKETEEAKI